ncbi:MAG: VOC family protein [Actinomycetes bacterium]
MPPALHHVELWTTDLGSVVDAWDWLLTSLGWRDGDTWPHGHTWHHPDGTYLVLEQSADVRAAPHDRTRAGLNHLALWCDGRDHLDSMRTDGPSHGWTELFGDRYPHAGGPDHTALFLENAQGFEIELVATP